MFIRYTGSSGGNDFSRTAKKYLRGSDWTRFYDCFNKVVLIDLGDVKFPVSEYL